MYLVLEKKVKLTPLIITTTTTNSDQVCTRHFNILWISKGTENLSDTIDSQTT